MRGKDCAGEVQIVERTTSIKEAVRGFSENLAFECRVSGAGGRRQGEERNMGLIKKRGMVYNEGDFVRWRMRIWKN